MDPVKLTPQELETVLRVVTGPNALLILSHLQCNPVASSADLTRIAGGNFSSSIHNCVNKRLVNHGLRIRYRKGHYAWQRFRAVDKNLSWPVCPTPTANRETIWIIR